MTREEAIERLKQNKAAAEYYAGITSITKAVENELKDVEAFNMAIEALRQTEWIPVSEALPEEDVDVLITYRYREGEGDTSARYIDTTSYGDFYFGGREIKDYKHWRQPFAYFDQNYEVIAWMPLPEPYKGGEE